MIWDPVSLAQSNAIMSVRNDETYLQIVSMVVASSLYFFPKLHVDANSYFYVDCFAENL